MKVVYKPDLCYIDRKFVKGASVLVDEATGLIEKVSIKEELVCDRIVEWEMRSSQ